MSILVSIKVVQGRVLEFGPLFNNQWWVDYSGRYYKTATTTHALAYSEWQLQSALLCFNLFCRMALAGLRKLYFIFTLLLLWLLLTFLFFNLSLDWCWLVLSLLLLLLFLLFCWVGFRSTTLCRSFLCCCLCLFSSFQFVLCFTLGLLLVLWHSCTLLFLVSSLFLLLSLSQFGLQIFALLFIRWFHVR